MNGALTIQHFLALSGLLFSMGVVGIYMNRRNIIVVLMAIELMLLAVNINFVGFAALHGNLEGQIFSFFILTVAAAEAAIGLAILVIYFRKRGSIDIDAASELKG
jgi:NADH-quinone oxidoreductase subunit K